MSDQPPDDVTEPPAGEDAEAGDEAGDALPPSPYPLDETARWMAADDVLAVRLGGSNIGRAIAMDIAVPFLFKLHTLVAVIAAKFGGREAGTRGPAPEVPEAGLLSLAALAPANSVVFRFGLGPGEAFALTPHGETSPTQEVISIVTGLLEASEDLDEGDLYKLALELGPRVANNYFDLVQTLRKSAVVSTWETQTARAPITLSPVKLRQVEEILNRPGPPQISEQTLRGWFFRADGREHKFQFEREGFPGERLHGEYPPTLREAVRRAWDKQVEIRAVVAEEHLLRQEEPAKIELQLLEVVRVIGEHD